MWHRSDLQTENNIVMNLIETYVDILWVSVPHSFIKLSTLKQYIIEVYYRVYY